MALGSGHRLIQPAVLKGTTLLLSCDYSVIPFPLLYLYRRRVFPFFSGCKSIPFTSLPSD